MENVIKRDGVKVPFKKKKITKAIEKAMACTPEGIDSELADRIADIIAREEKDLTVEQIQDKVEEALMGSYRKDVAREYINYRFLRGKIRETEKANQEILEIVDSKNEYVNEENSNKNPKILSTQRDYIAGAVSKDLTERLLLPKDIVAAHKAGIIHFHDADYFVQHNMNCCLINLEDMLQNGTVISGTLIEKPHSFSTACNIATQVIAQIASNQYGGQSVSLTHLAPFVDISRQKIRKQVEEEFRKLRIVVSDNQIAEVVEERLREEIKKGIQTIQYQVVTLLTSNG